MWSVRYVPSVRTYTFSFYGLYGTYCLYVPTPFTLLPTTHHSGSRCDISFVVVFHLPLAYLPL